MEIYSTTIITTSRNFDIIPKEPMRMIGGIGVIKVNKTDFKDKVKLGNKNRIKRWRDYKNKVNMVSEQILSNFFENTHKNIK